jgi:NOL1/NOP2/fmu family ribosome biogenesis protein
MAYLRHEALVLPADTPRGIVEVCFLGHPLGLAKNIGNRANNLYPKEWKIKTTHIPNEYEPILKKI